MRFRDDLELRRRVAEEAARAAGAIHLQYRGHKLDRDVHAGERADYTTEVDLAAQQAVRDAVARRFPHERVIGEEDKDGFSDIEHILDSGCWLTDPLDGTLEYVHGASGYSCVVSYVEGGRPLAAAVYFAAWDELFSAAEGMGATLNGAPIRVSGQRDLSAALFATPHRSTKPEDARRFADLMAKLVPHVEAFRMPGAPSMMACSVAAGRYDITSFLSPRQEPRPGGKPFPGQPWETCAFVLLVQEAGGAVQRFGGGPPDLLGHNAYAASPELLQQFFAVMRE